MPMVEIVKEQKEKPQTLMTHPKGYPAEVPARLVAKYLEHGYKIGYKEPKEVTERRALNKIDLVAENKKLKEQLEKLESKKKIKE